MSAVLYTLYTLLYLAMIGWALILWRKTRRWGTFFLFLVLFGLFYDNLILSIGNWMGQGPVLRALSLPRFWLHQLILPWIMVSGYEQARLTGLGWAQKPVAARAVWLGSLAILLLGVFTRAVGLQLAPEVMDGVLRYVAVDVSGPPVVSIVSIGFIGVMAFLAWRHGARNWIWLLVILVFIAEGLPVEALRRLLGSGLEVVLMVALLFEERALLQSTLNPDAKGVLP